MNVCLLTSDWKWTGPAEPMLQLGLALRARGHGVWIVAPAAPGAAGRSLAAEARAAGLPLALEIARARGLRWLRDRDDVHRLRGLIRERAIDVVHCWHTRDHLLALRALRRLGRSAPAETRDVAVVRSERRAEPAIADPFGRWLLGRGADGLVCVSPGAAERVRALRGERPLGGVFGAVDLQRFRPGPRPADVCTGPDAGADPGAASVTRARAELGLAPEHRVVGVVARVQPHRRFELLLAAAQRLFARDPRARLLIVGRGTRRAELAEAPARALGIADRVVFAGYRQHDYLDVLRAIDVLTFLVPGSDGTCRALLEAAACGIPAVVSRRGALPEIVEDGRTGLVVDESPDALADAWQALLCDDARRAALGAAAAVRAQRLFGPERLAREVEALYVAALRWRRGARATRALATASDEPRA